MSEALTPKLTREQYRIGYLNNMGKEIANEAYNLAAVASYLTDGESVGDAINQSATLTQGIPLATLKAVNAVKFRQLVENSTAAVQPLNMKEQQFIYTYSDAINQMIRSGYRTSDRGGGRISAQLFRQIVSDMMRGAMNHVPQYNNVTVPDAVETGDQTTNATSQFVDAETQMAQMGVPGSRASSAGSFLSSRFNGPLDHEYDASSSSGGPFRGPFSISSSSASSSSGGPFRGSRSSSSSSSSDGSDGGFFSVTSQDRREYLEAMRNIKAKQQMEAKEAIERGGMSAQDYRIPVSRSITTRDADRMNAGPYDPVSVSTAEIPTRMMDIDTPYVEDDEDVEPFDVEGFADEMAVEQLTKKGKKGFYDVVRKILPKRGKGLKGKGCGQKCCGAGLSKPLVPFGNYLIDLDDLNNSHLSLYTAKGNKQRKVPRQVIGGNVSNVLKSLVVGQRPKPKDILSLNEDERDYLNGVGMAAKIEDLQELPTKKKTETQKDMHEFEILKGQIAAGNDNKELVQDFKRKLIKMIHAKKVSKSEGHDLLLELASMGI